MVRNFKDEIKEQLLADIDESYETSQIACPPDTQGCLSYSLISRLCTPWESVIAMENEIIWQNNAAKQEIEAIWENVYFIADSYKERFDMLQELADSLKKKISLITEVLNIPANSNGYGRLEQLPEDFMNIFASVDSEINSKKYDVLYESLVNRDADGNIVGYNYDVINEILGRNPDEISAVEYQVIAMLYIGENADVVTSDMHIEFQNVVLNACVSPSSRKSDIQQYGNPATSVKAEYFENNQKMSFLYTAMLEAEKSFYQVVYNTEDLTKLQESGMWTRIEQAKTTFAVLSQKKDDYAMLSQTYLQISGNHYYQDSPLKLTRDEEGRVVVNFLDGGSICANGGLPTPQKFSEFVNDNLHSVKITGAMLGSTCGEFCDSDSIDLFVEECDINTTYESAIYQSAGDIGLFAVDKVLGEFNFTLEKIELINDVSDNFCEVNNYVRARENLDNSIEIMNYANYYKLGVVQITDEHAGHNSIEYKVVLGIGDVYGTKTTQQIVDNVNEKLELVGENQINLIDVLMHSNKVEAAHELIINTNNPNVGGGSSDIASLYSN